MAETWLLNATIDIGSSEKGFAINFTSNNTEYNSFYLAGNEKPQYLSYSSTTSTTSITSYTAGSGWADQAYRTVSFDNAPTGDLLTWLQANGTKQSASSPTFKHFFNSGTIGSGTIKFRHFSQTEPLPQLATPQNVAINGTTLSWDAVENATSYDIYADGTLIGNTDGGGSGGGTVTFNITEGSRYSRYYFRIYDGTDTSGTLLYEITNTSTAIPNPLTVDCSTGYLYISLAGSSVYNTLSNPTGGVSVSAPDSAVTQGVFYQKLTLKVISNGSINLSIEYDY